MLDTASGFGVFPLLLAPWPVIAADVGLFVGLPLLAALAAGACLPVRARHRGGRDGGGSARSHRGVAGARGRAARRYQVAGALLGAALGVVLVLSGYAFLALPACPAGYLAGILVDYRAGRRRPTGSIRSASLAPRRPSDYAPRAALVLATVCTLATIASLATVEVLPRLVALNWRPDSGSSGLALPAQPLPLFGPEQAGILAGIALGCAALSVLTLRQVAFAPATRQPPGTMDAGHIEAGWAATGAALALATLCLGEVLFLAGAVLSLPHVQPAAAGTVGPGVAFTGLGVIVVGLLAWVVLARRGRSPRAVLARAGTIA